jgi:hypothetical protein
MNRLANELYNNGGIENYLISKIIDSTATLSTLKRQINN